MSIILIGDSHSVPYQQYSSCAYSGMHDMVVTAERFSDFENQAFWGPLDSWINAHSPQGAKLLLAINEIDIRGHYWRHLPRTPEVSPADFVAARVDRVFTAIETVVNRYGFERAVLWGAPPATASTTYDADWPFVGGVPTRNRLINEFNRQFMARATSQVRYATGYYGFIDPHAYMPVNHMPTDGVHWDNSLTTEFWDNFITPLLIGDNLTASHPIPEKMTTDQYRISAERRLITDLYDTWMPITELAAQGDANEVTRRTQFDNTEYGFVNVRQHRHLFPFEYTELVLETIDS